MYTIEDFKSLGLYDESPPEDDHDFQNGKVITKLPSKVQFMLRQVGGSTHGGDRSKQDSAVITAMLRSGISPDDTFATFSASPRGQDAIERKNGHHQDYIERTIKRASGFIISKSPLSLNFSNERKVTNETGLVISMGHEVETERVNWVWPGYVPAGRITLIAGDPSMGKSTIVADMLSRISRGRLMASGTRGITGSSLIASAEDAPEDTIVPRLIASEADLKRIGIIREVREEGEVDKDETKYLCFPRDFNILRRTLINRACRVLVIDPLNAFIERGVDTYKDQDIRSILHPLEMIAQETGTAIIIVAHLNKKEDASTLYRIGGSIGFIGAARSVLAVVKNEDQNVLFSLKSNLAKRPPTLAYEIKSVRKHKTENNTWLGEDTINSSGIRWLGEVDFDPFAKRQEATGNKAELEEEAKSFLRGVLSEGAVESDLIYGQAKQAGINKLIVNRVRATLNVQISKRNGQWFWQLNR